MLRRSINPKTLGSFGVALTVFYFLLYDSIAQEQINPQFEIKAIAGHGTSGDLIPFDAFGTASLLPPSTSNLLASRDGKRLYIFHRSQILRFELESGRLDTLSGLGWPGYRDGPASIAQFDINFYQAGGHGLSPDGRHIYLTSNGTIRRIDTTTGDVSTIYSDAFPKRNKIRSLAVGRSGKLYLLFYNRYFVMNPDNDEVKEYILDRKKQGWGEKQGQPPGYIAVDEARGVVYGIERNRKNGAFYRWPILGGDVEWLNHETTGNRHRQYTSDGPVSRMAMANPLGCVVDNEGFVYIGAGDGRTFRRYDPDTETVDSLCRVNRAPNNRNLLAWCKGDGKRNKIFGTWPSFLAFDNMGNRYVGYSVWPRLLQLEKIDP